MYSGGADTKDVGAAGSVSEGAVSDNASADSAVASVGSSVSDVDIIADA